MTQETASFESGSSPEEPDTAVTLATVCFVRRQGQVLLQRRAPGRRWAGRLNGPGGKIAAGESPEHAVSREVLEETGLSLQAVTRRGVLDLIYGQPPAARLRVFIFTSDAFSGRARGGREGRLRWYAESRLPFDTLWPDMRFWLPAVLAGGTVDGTCAYDAAGVRLHSCSLRIDWRDPAVS